MPTLCKDCQNKAGMMNAPKDRCLICQGEQFKRAIDWFVAEDREENIQIECYRGAIKPWVLRESEISILSRGGSPHEVIIKAYRSMFDSNIKGDAIEKD